MPKRLALAIAVALSLAGCSTLTAPPVERAEPQPPADTRAQLMYDVLVGEIAGQRGELGTSVAHYVRAAELSDDPAVAERATHISVYAGDYTSALKAARRWAELAPSSLEAQQFAAMLSVRAGDADGALPYMERILGLAAEDPSEGFLLITSLLAREGDPALATKAMGLLVAEHPEVASAHHGLALMALRSEDFELALGEAERALEIDPDLIDARITGARALMGLGRPDEALARLEAMLAEMPKHHELRLTYARMLLSLERYDDALVQFEEVAKARPTDGDLLYTIALLSIEAERYEAAETYLKRVLKTGRHVNEGHYYLGRIAEQRGDYKQGIAWYLKVVDGEQRLDAQFRIATLFGKLGHVDKARDHLAALREHLAEDDALIRAYLVEAQVLRDARAYGDAMEVLNHALLEYPGEPDLLYSRALIAEKLDRLDILEADLLGILERDPDNASAMNALGYTLADRTDRYQEALDYISRALEQNPDDPAVIDSMGWVQYRLGNLAAAEEYLRRAYAEFPDPEVVAHLVEVLWVRGTRDEAATILSKALADAPENEKLLELKERLGL